MDGVVVSVWANTPRCLLLSFHLFPRANRESEAADVCVCVCMCVRLCVCVHVCESESASADEVDLHGLHISSRESPPTNSLLGPLATGPHHYSLESPRQRRSAL